MQERQTQTARFRALYRGAWLVALVLLIAICHMGTK